MIKNYSADCMQVYSFMQSATYFLIISIQLKDLFFNSTTANV